MATVDLTTETFEETVTKDGIVLVDFWAEWCGPCKRFSPIYDASSEVNTEVVHAKVDTEAEQALGAQFGVTAIPTLMAFRDGIMVFQQAGALPAPRRSRSWTPSQDSTWTRSAPRLAEQQA
ncbi:thioredoxin [Demequina litorisediminis]|uniref:Thioredoxin n=1 Tax=Demequina litorisediminis TaxID=1849022 RepID=A0ABQ6IAA3_9MICO|nr:thioredoxin [Demequina litorisediminis]